MQRYEHEELYFCESKNAAPLHRPTFELKLNAQRDYITADSDLETR